MEYVTPRDACPGEPPQFGHRGRDGDSSSGERRRAPVLIRIPHLTHSGRRIPAAGRSEEEDQYPPSGDGNGRGTLTTAASPPFRAERHSTRSHEGAERRIDGPERDAFGRGEREVEALPAPQRRVSPAEQALRRLRREVQPMTSHAARNTIILVAILIAATGLTVWMTQGLPTENVSSPPTSALNSPADEVPADEEWGGFHFDTGSTGKLEDRWASGPVPSSLERTARVPNVDAWPPSQVQETYVPAPDQSFAPMPTASHFPGERAVRPLPATGPSAAHEPAPVANLITIEPPPVRR